MELLDLEADRGPARRDELDRTVERVSDSAQRARPMLANMVGEVRGALDRQNGVGNLGTGRSSGALDFVLWRLSTIHQRSPMRLKLVRRLSSTKFWSRIGAWARRATMSPFRIMVARQYRRRRRFSRAVRSYRKICVSRFLLFWTLVAGALFALSNTVPCSGWVLESCGKVPWA